MLSQSAIKGTKISPKLTLFKKMTIVINFEIINKANMENSWDDMK